MRDSGFKAFRIFGIDIYIDYSWLFIFLVVFWIFTVNFYPKLYPDFSPTQDIIFGLITALLFFSSALLHELSHSIVSIKSGIEIRRITLFLFGGIAELFDEPKNPKQEFYIASAGPLMSVVLAGVFYLLSILFTYTIIFPAGVAIAHTLAELNMILAVFNLLPGFPLDGGRILRSMSWQISKDLKKATQIATNSGRILALLLIGLGVVEIFTSGIISGIWLILIGLFLNQAAKQSYLEVLINDELKNETVIRHMRDNTIFVTPQLSIDELLGEYFLKYHSLSFPVIQNDEIVGFVSLKDIRNKKSEELRDSKVWNLMRRFPYQLSVAPADRLLSALKIMLVEDITFVPVKDNGKLKGVVTLEDISDFLEEKKII